MKIKIAILSQVIMLILSVVWYLQKYEIEPLIAIIGFLVTLLGTLFFQSKKSDSKLEIKVIKGEKGVEIKAEIKNSKAKLKDIKSSKGKVNININLE